MSAQRSRRPLPPPRDPSWRVVRLHQRRLHWSLGIGAVSAPIGFLAFMFTIEPAYYLPWSLLLLGVPGMFLLTGFLLELEEAYFEYEIHSFSVRGIDQWGRDLVRRWRRERSHPWDQTKGVYPQAGFVRLEYSVESAEVYQVREDGTRERLWMRPGWAEPADWEAFVRHLRRIGALHHVKD